jgi:hypothetical protein
MRLEKELEQATLWSVPPTMMTMHLDNPEVTLRPNPSSWRACSPSFCIHCAQGRVSLFYIPARIQKFVIVRGKVEIMPVTIQGKPLGDAVEFKTGDYGIVPGGSYRSLLPIPLSPLPISRPGSSPCALIITCSLSLTPSLLDCLIFACVCVCWCVCMWAASALRYCMSTCARAQPYLAKLSLPLFASSPTHETRHPKPEALHRGLVARVAHACERWGL